MGAVEHPHGRAQVGGCDGRCALGAGACTCGASYCLFWLVFSIYTCVALRRLLVGLLRRRAARAAAPTVRLPPRGRSGRGPPTGVPCNRRCLRVRCFRHGDPTTPREKSDRPRAEAPRLEVVPGVRPERLRLAPVCCPAETAVERTAPVVKARGSAQGACVFICKKSVCLCGAASVVAFFTVLGGED